MKALELAIKNSVVSWHFLRNFAKIQNLA